MSAIFPSACLIAITYADLTPVGAAALVVRTSFDVAPKVPCAYVDIFFSGDVDCRGGVGLWRTRQRD